MSFSCSICQENINNKQKFTTPCKHDFCNECLTHWLFINTSCPMCREEFGDKVDERTEVEVTEERADEESDEESESEWESEWESDEGDEGDEDYSRSQPGDWGVEFPDAEGASTQDEEEFDEDSEDDEFSDDEDLDIMEGLSENSRQTDWVFISEDIRDGTYNKMMDMIEFLEYEDGNSYESLSQSIIDDMQDIDYDEKRKSFVKKFSENLKNMTIKITIYYNTDKEQGKIIYNPVYKNLSVKKIKKMKNNKFNNREMKINKRINKNYSNKSHKRVFQPMKRC